MQKNKFFILGLPRSGTTAVAKTLNSYDNVHMHSTKKVEGVVDNESYLFEPFALANSKVVLDWRHKLQYTIEPKFKKDYNGFKIILGDQVNIRSLAQDFNYRPLIVIRKDIWKVIFSKIAASYATHEETGAIGTYLQSSRTANADFTKFRPTVPRLEFFLGTFIKAIYELENETYILDPIDIIYFEDFIKPDTTYNKINKYFEKEITFNLNYNDEFDVINEYLSEAGWTSNQYKYLASRIDAMIERYSIKEDPKIPEWLKETLINHPFIDK